MMKLLLNNVYNINCEEGIDRLYRQGITVNCIITSPPYNLNHRYDFYKDDKPFNEYIEWLESIFSKCRNILNNGSTVCINIGDGKNGSIPTHSFIIQFMLKLNYKLMSTIIWNKNHVVPRTSWGSWMSPSHPSFPTPFEYVLIFRYKDLRYNCNKDKITVTKKQFIDNSLAMWNIAPEKKQKDHPAKFPEEIPKRLIQQLTCKGDLLLDIFSGSGTTCKVAKDLNRKYLGFEISEDYYKLSKERLKK